MLAIDYLKQVGKIDDLVNRELETVGQLRSNITDINVKMGTDKVQSGQVKDAIGDTVAKIIDLENEINEHIEALIKVKAKILRVIRMMDKLDEQNILIARFVQLKSMRIVADELGFNSIRGCYTFLNKAIKNFEKKYNSVHGCS